MLLKFRDGAEVGRIGDEGILDEEEIEKFMQS